MKLRILLFLILSCTQLFSQIGFEERIILDRSKSVNEVVEMVSGDIDGDGDLDLVLGHHNNSISWIENDGDFHTIDKVKNVGVTNFSYSKIALIDVDNDSDLDIICAPFFNDTPGVVWFENLDGKGNFAFYNPLSIGTYRINSIVATDLDNNGDIDVFVSQGYPFKHVKWIKGYYSGTYFETEQIIASDIREPVIHLDDIDNDGMDELFVQSWLDGKLHVYKQFNSEYSRIFSTSSWNANYIATGDIDGDGFVDIVHQNTWLRNLNNWNVFEEAGSFRQNIDLGDRVQVKDVDGDGDNDILISRREKDIIAWHENLDGSGTFSDEIILSDNSQTPIVALAEDFDLDGDLDIMAASEDDAKIGYFENINNTSFSEESKLTESIYYPSEILPVDIDGDGDLDVISTSIRDSKIAWYENKDGLGDFGRQRIISVESSGVSNIQTIDFDGDGDLDIIATGAWTYPIALYEHLDGKGTFSDQILITEYAKGATELELADIDGDGDLDMVCAHNYRDELFWFENVNGLVEFGPKKLLDSATNILDLEVRDLDDDGYLDIIAASGDENQIIWYRNLDGNGNFGEKIIINDDVKEASSVYTSDIDKDGDLDIFFTSKEDNSASWQENLGQVSFGPPQLINEEVSGDNIYSADIDNDGFEDILTIAYSGSRLFWYRNNDGDGTFGTGQKIGSSFCDPAFISLADINNDGKVDILSAKWGDGGLKWYENLGVQYNTVSGIVQFSPDGQCITNPTPVPYFMLSTETNGEKLTQFTGKDGRYIFSTFDGEVITEVVSEIPDYIQIDPEQHTTTFNGLGNSSSADFCMQSNENINDLEITLYPIGDARPGFVGKYEIVIENLGTATQSGEVLLMFDDSKLELKDTNFPFDVVNNNSIQFIVEDLLPFNKQSIDLSFQIKAPPIVDINQHLIFEVSVDADQVDMNPDNNLFILDQLTVGSFDPNDIIVLEGPLLDIAKIDNYLHYTIRFQNTGTASAIFVRIENELVDKLDKKTLKIESMSHDATVTMEEDKLTFFFDNINLPDSSDYEGSQGYVSYKIKPYPDLQIGEIISNVADIHFDFNLPITTNTVETMIFEPVVSNVKENSFDFELYPNPASEHVTIVTTEEVSHIEIIDLEGEIIRHVDRSKTINISQIAAGLYFCKVYTSHGKMNIKKILIH
ncbi:MAG: FG-GAP-like repeat-containing protein [Saprospiraceae bacterium]|nr:FG-GAP-like repeat-containing protein [Saprospiraceae bacterium]